MMRETEGNSGSKKRYNWGLPEVSMELVRVALALIAFLSLCEYSLCQVSPSDSAASSSGTKLGDVRRSDSNSRSIANKSALPEKSIELAVSLVQQSHELNAYLPLVFRLQLLGGQIQMISKWRPDLSRLWNEELSALSLEQKRAEALVTQERVVESYARTDPRHALDLLRSMTMSTAGSEARPSFYVPKTGAARSVFIALVTRDGVGVLPMLEEEASRMGAEGHYPYTAIGAAAMQAVSSEWKENRDGAVAVIQPIFERSFERYSQETGTDSDNLEFGEMLQHVAGSLPPGVVRPALRLFVRRLMTMDTGKYPFEEAGEVGTIDGEIARVDNTIDSRILRLGSLINRIDPELAQLLESTRPELKQALEYTKAGRMTGGSFGSKPQNLRPPDPYSDIQSQAMRLSRTDLDSAIAKAEELPDEDRRNSTILDIASAIGGDDPKRAAELIAQVQPKIGAGDNLLQLRLIAAQAQLAAAQNKLGELDLLLRRGFGIVETGARMYPAPPKNAVWMMPVVAVGEGLVRIGMQNDPEVTVAFLQSLPVSYQKANLFLLAASALDMPRLPLNPRPQPKAEKPGK